MPDREQPNRTTQQDIDIGGNVENSTLNMTQIGGDQVNVSVSAIVIIIVGVLALLAIVVWRLPASVTDPVLRVILPPTPLEGTPFAPSEIGVVLADFTRIDPNTLSIEPNLEREFTAADVPFVRVQHPLTSREDARAVAELYNATIVMWGEIAEGGVNVNFEVLSLNTELRTVIDGLTVSTADLDNFEAYVFEGMDTLYIVDFVRGQLHLYNDNYETALTFLESAEQRIPAGRAHELQAAALYFFLGATQQNLGQPADAVHRYDRALELNPDYAFAYNNRGAAHVQLGNMEAAIADFEQSIAAGNPEIADPYNNLGVVYTEQGDYAAAVDAFTQAISANPDSASFIYNRGVVHANLTNYEAAIEDYQRAIELEPNDAAFYNSLGFAYAQLDEFKNAVDALQTAISLDNTIASPYGTLASIYDAQNNIEQAVTNYARYIDLAGDDADPLAITRLAALQSADGE